MLKRSFLLCGLLTLAMLSASCIFDPKPAPPDVVAPPQTYTKLPRTTREAVLNNIQYAYNKRDITTYDELLDTDFTFFLAPGDVGGQIPEQWGRAEEVRLTGLLFSQDPGPQYPKCKRIEFDLKFEDGVQWIPVVPQDYPNETWYLAVVVYYFNIDVEPDTQYQPAAGSQAQFTVRNVGTDAAPEWKLVEFRDLGA